LICEGEYKLGNSNFFTFFLVFCPFFPHRTKYPSQCGEPEHAQSMYIPPFDGGFFIPIECRKQKQRFLSIALTERAGMTHNSEANNNRVFRALDYERTKRYV
jgi:hypothetical protein